MTTTTPGPIRTQVDQTSERQLGELIVSLLPLLGRFATQILREQGGPSPERIRLLKQLHHGPVRAGELAQSCLLSPATVSELTDALVRDGHIRRDTDPGDRRAVVLGLTSAGAHELARVEEALGARIAARLAHLRPDERARLAAALTDLRVAFTDPTASKEASRHGR